MEFQTWLLYVIAVFVLTASPGPSVLLCMTKAVTAGFHASLRTALGSLTAILGIMTLSFTGLGIVVSSSEFVFTVIKWGGAAYLIYLGYKAFTSSEDSYQVKSVDSQLVSRAKWSLFRSGFLVGASNPKAIVFFTALFPQFISPNDSLMVQYLVFCSTFAVLELGWLVFYAYLGACSSDWILKRGRAKFFNRLTGSTFISAGVLLSVSER
ncbi:LysE family translocator [Alteromonas sp. KUL49]|uniref:LysE family translocator n=1 Tax=Alteromonas sp. KUL49 TaxID=2480798 RepID=UPI00102EF528|nr:LysE family translocator [Alteromonas sp. KUL49]TAP41014.1 LysE family translocator [Alteromonas sp. KUL49]GEA11209.1 flagellar biosynthesis protein FlgM [Alteromonas sp. KUL49]